MRISLDRTTHRAAIAVAVLALLWIPWAPVRVMAVFIVAGVLPGLALALHRRTTIEGALGIGTSLSPVIFAALTLASMVLGAHVHHAAIFASVVALVLFVRCAAPTLPPSTDDRRALVGACAILLTAAVLALSLPLSDMWWRVREDSWYHAAVANKLARDGLPLDDPYFAGLRIQYMYAYHAIVAGCASLAGIDYFRAMILVNAMALTSSLLAFHALAGQFTRRVVPRVLAVALWIFGMNGWFYLSFPVRLLRAMVGETQGLQTLFPATTPGHAAAMSILSVEGNQFMFLDKFMIGTALSLTFGLAATLLLLLMRARRGDWCPRDDIAFVGCVAGSMLLHLVTGLTIAVATAVVLALLLIVKAQPSPGGPSYGRLIGWIALALAATAPYVFSVMPRDGGQAAIIIALQRSQTIGLLFAVLPALVFAIVFVRAMTRDSVETAGSRPVADMSLSASGIVMMWALVVAAMGLTVDLATNNETKFAFLLYLPVAALAAGGIDCMWGSPRRYVALALVASAVIPLHAVYFYQASRDPSRFDIDDEERAVNAWVEKNTPPDAVFIEANDTVRIPVLASRDTYWGTEAYARNWGYSKDEMTMRKRLRDAFFSKSGAGEVEMIQLRTLARPVYVIFRSQPDDLIDASERFENDSRFRGRFTTNKIAVWELFADERRVSQ